MKNGQEYQFDVIILATGFDSVSGSLCQIDIKGTDGVPLADKWSKGISTYLGMTTANFPNMYFLYGPQGRSSASEIKTCTDFFSTNWIRQWSDYGRTSRRLGCRCHRLL
jgi:cation diffusion facilitator CzcD-associated flavoprotein CzcO